MTAALLKKINVTEGMSPVIAIQRTRDYLDNQPDRLKAANQIMASFGLPNENNQRKAYVFVMSAVEKLVNGESISPDSIVERANRSVVTLKSLVGENVFNVGEQPKGHAPVSRKGSKREVAKQLYLEFKEQGEAFVIAKVMEALEVTKQNAYTYVYLVKKDLLKK
jgi:hypothetical protein